MVLPYTPGILPPRTALSLHSRFSAARTRPVPYFPHCSPPMLSCAQASIPHALFDDLSSHWHYVRCVQCLGTAYLLDAKPDLALQSFTKDLKVFPENGWSLFGSALALKSMGKRSEAAAMQGRAEIAWQSSETTLESPCFQLTSAF